VPGPVGQFRGAQGTRIDGAGRGTPKRRPSEPRAFRSAAGVRRSCCARREGERQYPNAWQARRLHHRTHGLFTAASRTEPPRGQVHTPGGNYTLSLQAALTFTEPSCLPLRAAVALVPSGADVVDDRRDDRHDQGDNRPHHGGIARGAISCWVSEMGRNVLLTCLQIRCPWVASPILRRSNHDGRLSDRPRTFHCRPWRTRRSPM